MATKTYRVMVECRLKCWYEIEADSKADAINEAESTVGAGDVPDEIEFVEQFGTAKVESVSID